MPTSKKRVKAFEGDNINHYDGSPTDIYDPLMGPGLAPVRVDEKDFPPSEEGRPRPTIGDPYYRSTILVPASRQSRRLNRIACQMIRNGFKGS